MTVKIWFSYGAATSVKTTSFDWTLDSKESFTRMTGMVSQLIFAA
jgi:hypothetical protein